MTVKLCNCVEGAGQLHMLLLMEIILQKIHNVGINNKFGEKEKY